MIRDRYLSETVARYIVHKIEHLYRDCWKSLLTNEEVIIEYIGLLSHGGLKNPPVPLSTVVSQSFAVVDASSPAIRLLNIPVRKAGIKILAKYVDSSFIACEKDTDDFYNRVFTVVCNCFFNNLQKRSNESVIKDIIAEFKRIKRQKEWSNFRNFNKLICNSSFVLYFRKPGVV